MNCLGVSCSSSGIAVTALHEKYLISNVLNSPKCYGKGETNLMLDMHRNHLVSLTYKYNIDTLALKQVENTSFSHRRGLTDGQRDQLYLEGMVFSLAGFLGLNFKCYQKVNIIRILGGSVEGVHIYERFRDVHFVQTNMVDEENENVMKSSIAVLCAIEEE